MTRLHKRVSFSDNDRPQFFKVFIPKFNAKKMLLPPAFVRKFIPKTLENTRVRDSSGKTWDIAMVIRENKVYFDNNWEDFAKEQSLEFGDFLLFTYSTMNLLFDVKIFGQNGCKKELKAVPKSPGHVKVEAEETESEEIGSKGLAKKQGSSEEIRTKRRETSSAKCAAPTNLHFLVSIKNGKATQSSAHIPLAVMKEIKFKPNASLRCQNNKLWPVKISTTRCDGRGAITTGWPKFREGNSLGRNDKCAFEPVLGEGNVCEEIKVRVIRESARRAR